MDSYFLPRLIRTLFVVPSVSLLTGFNRNKSLLLNWIGPGSCFAALSKLVLDLIYFQPTLMTIQAKGKFSKSTTGSLKINPAVQPRPQGFSLKNSVLRKSPGDEVARRRTYSGVVVGAEDELIIILGACTWNHLKKWHDRSYRPGGLGCTSVG